MPASPAPSGPGALSVARTLAVETGLVDITESRARVTDITARSDALTQSERGREFNAQVAQTRKSFREGVDKFMALIAVGEREQAVAPVF